MDNEDKLITKRKGILILTISCIMMTAYILFCPTPAFAATDSVFNFGGLIGMIRSIVTMIVLPVCIVWVSWKLLYLAIVVGLIGMDPLKYCQASGAGGVDYNSLVKEIKYQLMQVVKGLCWVGGIFIIFQIVIVIASSLAGVFGEAFG